MVSRKTAVAAVAATLASPVLPARAGGSCPRDEAYYNGRCYGPNHSIGSGWGSECYWSAWTTEPNMWGSVFAVLSISYNGGGPVYYSCGFLEFDEAHCVIDACS